MIVDARPRNRATVYSKMGHSYCCLTSHGQAVFNSASRSQVVFAPERPDACYGLVWSLRLEAALICNTSVW